MIITRSPLRITLGAGPTDIPAYYEKHGGFTISMAINKYIYIARHSPIHHDDIHLRYSKTEIVENFNDIQHAIFREVLNKYPQWKPLEITALADVPSGTGLGSSSAFTAALIHNVGVKRNRFSPDTDSNSSKKLAERVCTIELNKLKSPIGKQDQYTTVYGGINTITYTSEEIQVDPIFSKITDYVYLFYTGHTREANKQLEKLNFNDPNTISLFNDFKALTIAMAAALKKKDIYEYSRCIKVYNKLKTGKTEYASIIEAGIRAGALAGKLIGAGGGGFIMFIAEPHKFQFLLQRMNELGLKYLRTNVDYEGTRDIDSED